METLFFNSTHLHITTWVIAIILFFIALGKYSTGTHMALRLFYILVIATGVLLFVRHHSMDDMLYGMKMLAGLVTIGLMEMALVRKKKGKETSMMLIAAVLLLIVTLYLGFRLPMGFNFFA
ncbi:YisL family protein [Bacillus xiapuensis]|uniref:YisL family protein n=1 Tax=Bacillus xiapuensis TaxID=2014075 RepID=UPI000C231FC6|nr:YisL family protein [Bacillus xiapuensis]